MTPEIIALETQILELKKQLAEAQKSAPREEFADFGLVTVTGPVTLSGLFGDRDELLLVHNMGKSCTYCTLWADGLNGLRAPLEDRAAFVVVSPDDPATQSEFAMSRGWTFRMASDASGDLTRTAGFLMESGDWWPGVSAFVRDATGIYRTGKAFFGPGDDFCAVWPLMDLLGGPNGWEPKYEY